MNVDRESVSNPATDRAVSAIVPISTNLLWRYQRAARARGMLPSELMRCALTVYVMRGDAVALNQPAPVPAPVPGEIELRPALGRQAWRERVRAAWSALKGE